MILDLWGISFHAVVVFGLGKDLLFKSVLGHYDISNHKNVAFLFLSVETKWFPKSDFRADCWYKNDLENKRFRYNTKLV